MHRGLFLSVDGLDGTGKSTQCRLLIEFLRGQGYPVTHAIDPGGTDLGARVRELLLFGRQTGMGMRAEALLFMASRAELVDQVIRPALARGEVVVSDRYLLANVVYQGHAGGLDADDLWRVGRFSAGGIEPDLTFVFDLPVEAALARRGRAADRLECRDRAYQEAVRAGFRAEVERDPERRVLVDAAGDVDHIQARVRAVAAGWVAARRDRLSLPTG